MKDITAKNESFREAKASAFIEMPEGAQLLLRERRLEKGDALEIARMAGIMAAKRTHELIPFCHGILINQAEISYAFLPEGVNVECRVRCIAATGVEMEALTGASLAALTLYDMLKPHTTELRISEIRLVSKVGGKSDFQETLDPPAKVVILLAQQEGKATLHRIVEAVKGGGAEIVQCIDDIEDAEALRSHVLASIESNIELILTIGGTGLGSDDDAIETIAPMIERYLPGVMEAARSYGQRRTPYSMLSRGIAGVAKNTLIVTLPGSQRGALESFEAIFPGLWHAVKRQREGRGAL